MFINGYFVDGYFLDGYFISDPAYVPTDLMLYGNCEDATNPPQIDGYTKTSNFDIVRSGDQKAAGSYSWKFTKNTAAAGLAYYHFVSAIDPSDLHGFTRERKYTLTMKVYIPAGGLIGTDLAVALSDYQGDWESTTVYGVNSYDAWQTITVERTIKSYAGGATGWFYWASNTGLDATMYLDSVTLIETVPAAPAGPSLITTRRPGLQMGMKMGIGRI